MRATTTGAFSVSVPIRRLVIGGLAVLAASQVAFTANAQPCAGMASPQAATPKCLPMSPPPRNPVASPYVCTTDSLTIRFNTYRVPLFGVSWLGKAVASTDTITIKPDVVPPGIPIADGISVDFEATYRDRPFKVAIATVAVPVKFVNGEYAVKFSEFPQQFVSSIDQTLPRDFDPATMSPTAALKVTITPLFVKDPKTASAGRPIILPPITINMKHVLGKP